MITAIRRNNYSQISISAICQNELDNIGMVAKIQYRASPGFINIKIHHMQNNFPIDDSIAFAVW